MELGASLSPCSDFKFFNCFHFRVIPGYLAPCAPRAVPALAARVRRVVSGAAM